MKHRIWITIFAATSLFSQAIAQDHPNPPGQSLTRAQIMLTTAQRDIFQKAMGLEDQQKHSEATLRASTVMYIPDMHPAVHSSAAPLWLS
jgi:hypothetical protein